MQDAEFTGRSHGVSQDRLPSLQRKEKEIGQGKKKKKK